MNINNFVQLIIIIIVILFIEYSQNESDFEVNGVERTREKVLSRKRRYVAFPEGSSFSVALCTTIGVIGNPNVNFLSYALNWGVAYDLPNDTWVLHNVNGFKNDNPDPMPVMQRRFRRDLYNKVEIAINNMGYNGKNCILRALCESSKYFLSRKGTMVEEMLKSIFSLPKESLLSYEHRDLHDYDDAFKKKVKITDCSVLYPGCGFSLLELALGKYSYPESGFM